MNSLSNKCHIDHLFSSISILDEHEKDDLEQLGLSDFVDESSFREKIEQIIDNKRDEKRVKDLIVELLVAREFLKLKNLSLISFEENPDIIVTVKDKEYGVEVKRFRDRDQDIEDDKKLKEDDSSTLVAYGDPAAVQGQVERMIRKAVKKHHKSYTLFVYLWSDSPYQVESPEMEFAAKAVLKESGCEFLAGVFYKSVWCEIESGCSEKLVCADKKLAEKISPYSTERCLVYPS